MPHEFDGVKYEKASAHQKEWGGKLIAELDLRGGERVLDLGCGDGALTAQIAARVPKGEVVGLDASQGMIEVARERRADNLRFVLMDINALDLAGPFDVVFSNATLHWIKDHPRLLESVRALLRDGGVVRFNFAADGNCSRFFAVIKEAMGHPDFVTCFDDFNWPWFMPSVEDYGAIVSQSGLRDARVWGENADRLFPDAETMIRWVDQPSLVPFLARVPEGAKPAFRKFVVTRMLEATRHPEGGFFETFRRLNVSARK